MSFNAGVVVYEDLSIYKDIASKQFSGIQIKKNCPFLSHLFFADDALLLVDPTIDGVQNLMRSIKIFETASGQLINFDKSSLIINFDKSSLMFSANVPIQNRRAIMDILKMEEMDSEAKYLGIPSCWGKTKSETYSYLIERSVKKMQV
ncbi:hypothetical protein Vadar_008180 [Vaccinium darrowii]|uniref:Uncharacterized protein n=1 Tax=Vaccinium darrowii TaxID=229202 RepID=A0ACB7XG09_9ERIC|nr:hypothetical protein Vadar_008180 [Vaccinium darrowii]